MRDVARSRLQRAGAGGALSCGGGKWVGEVSGAAPSKRTLSEGAADLRGRGMTTQCKIDLPREVARAAPKIPRWPQSGVTRSATRCSRGCT